MQTIQDIFRIWPKYAVLANEIGERPDTVRKWWGKRIPQEKWVPVIAAAAKRDVTLTADELMRLNPPRKARDPSSWRRKARKIRRGKARKQAASAPEAATS